MSDDTAPSDDDIAALEAAAARAREMARRFKAVEQQQTGSIRGASKAKAKRKQAKAARRRNR
jgi:hypothetical protein